MDPKLPPPLKKRKLNDTADNGSVDESEPKAISEHKETSEDVVMSSASASSSAVATGASPSVAPIDTAAVNAALEPQKTFASFQTPVISSPDASPAPKAQNQPTPTKAPPAAEVHINGIQKSPTSKSEVVSGNLPTRSSKVGSPSPAAASASITQNHMEDNVKNTPSPRQIPADAMEVDEGALTDHGAHHEPSSSDNQSHGRHYASLHNHSQSHQHGHYHVPREPSSHHDDISEDELYHPEHIRLRSAGVALYEDEEIDGLWDRLTKDNQKIMFKQFLRRHPEHVGQLWVLADRESNVTELIKTKFDKINRKIDRCLQPNVFSWNDLEDSQKTAEAVAEYRQTLENRSENLELDQLVKQTSQLIESYLDVVSSYIQRGKLKISLLIVSTIVGNFSLSRACSENYLTPQEEHHLASKFTKVAQRFLDNEHQPRAIKLALFSHIYTFADKLTSDDARQTFFKNLKDLGAPDAPNSAPVVVTEASASSSAATEIAPAPEAAMPAAASST